jgi:DNA-binding LacI/PurR family transcriptional regulator
MSQARRATIITLSEEAGVAPSTVSRALKCDTRISAETRARIARLAKELGYTPHASGRILSSGRSGLVGLVLGPSSNPFYTELLHEAFRQGLARGMRLLLIHAGAGPVENRTADALLQYQVDGCLMASVELPSHAAAVCAANGVPVVMVNRVARLHSSAVACDNGGGSAELAELLLRSGRRCFVLVGTSSPSSTAREREKGFVEHLAQAGTARRPKRLDGRSTYEGGFEAGRQICELPRGERPDAIFAVSDIMAMGVLDALRQAGIRAGRDVSVVGFDGLPSAAWPAYDLTTVEQPLAAMAGRALELLQARIADRLMPDESITLRGRLIERGSSRVA